MLKLTVLEYFADMDLVHVHCEQQICPDLDLPEALTKHLSSTKVLQNRPNRLFYVVPPFGIVMPINDIISFKVLFEWLKKNVHQIYAVIMNSTTPDLKKVSLSHKIINNSKFYFKQSKNYEETHFNYYNK
jgi:hypothetical protein